jgi:hypothetical protein
VHQANGHKLDGTSGTETPRNPDELTEERAMHAGEKPDVDPQAIVAFGIDTCALGGWKSLDHP